MQLYVGWMTYINWYYNEISFKLRESNSFTAMAFLYPILCLVPIIPLVVVYFTSDKKYLTYKWMLTKEVISKIW